MNFDYNEEQQLLADSVRRFIQKDYAFEARRKILAGDGWSAAAWRTFAELGLLGLAAPAEHGGFGGGAVDLMGVMEAFGEALVVEPFLPTAALGARLVARAGSEAQKKRILPQLAGGKLKLAFAHAEAGARYDLSSARATAKRSGAGWRLEGEKLGVLGAPAAEMLIVSAVSENVVRIFLVNADQTRITGYRNLDSQLAGDIVLSATAAEPLGEGDALPLIEEVVDFATALVCAEGVGAMKYACDATLEYLKTRRQFGVPIGSFQALQHRIVDLYIAHEQARSMACLACSKVDSAASARERARAVSAAKIKVADSARFVSQEAVQLHGGMGMTEELKISHTFRRLTLIAQQFGDADHHLERFARAGE